MKTYAFLLALASLATAAHAQFNTNLVQNGSAESFVGDEDSAATFAGWTGANGVYVDRYSTFPVVYDGVAPTGEGSHYFLGGIPSTGDNTSLTETVDLGFASAAIDAGRARFDLSSWFFVRDQAQGTAVAEDSVALQVQFFSTSSSPLGASALGPYDGNRYAGNPSLFNTTVGLFGDLTGAVPLGTRSAVVSQLYVRHYGPTSNGGMDLVSLKVQAVPEPASFAALGLGALALLRRRTRKAVPDE